MELAVVRMAGLVQAVKTFDAPMIVMEVDFAAVVHVNVQLDFLARTVFQANARKLAPDMDTATSLHRLAIVNTDGLATIVQPTYAHMTAMDWEFATMVPASATLAVVVRAASS